MNVYYWPSKDKTELSLAEGCVATIGVFDGVHCGHRKVLFELVSESENLEKESLVITFDRPIQNTVGDAENARFITSLQHRLALFAKLGIDNTLIINFTVEIAQLSAKDFAENILKKKLNVSKLFLGFDGKFGKSGNGGIRTCTDAGIPAKRISPVKIGGEIISSTVIRNAIAEGNLVKTQKLLGRPYSIVGTVIHGDSYGTDIGFPTANLDTESELFPKEGVYAGRAIIDRKAFDAAISVGKRTTVHGMEAQNTVVEVYLINQNIDLYGRKMEVQFFFFIREQVNFAQVKDLKQQIARDVEKAKKLLNTELRSDI